MKGKISAICISLLLLTASCKKNDNAATAGSWTFEDVQYAASGAVYSDKDSTFTATCTSEGGSGSLTFYFPAPPQTGSYEVVNYTAVPLSAGQMYIRFINDQTKFYYFSTGVDHASAKVVVSPVGKINVNVSAFLESYARPQSDSAQVVASISQ